MSPRSFRSRGRTVAGSTAGSLNKIDEARGSESDSNDSFESQANCETVRRLNVGPESTDCAKYPSAKIDNYTWRAVAKRISDRFVDVDKDHRSPLDPSRKRASPH